MDDELTAMAAAGYELGAVFLDEDGDASGAVDLTDAPGLIARKIADVDRPLYPATLPCETYGDLSRPSTCWRAALTMEAD